MTPGCGEKKKERKKVGGNRDNAHDSNDSEHYKAEKEDGVEDGDDDCQCRAFGSKKSKLDFGIVIF